MSLLINNELIWVSTPKCATYSLETALLKSKLKIKKWGNNINPEYSQIRKEGQLFSYHLHVPINDLYNEFGKKDTVCINRNWFSRWLSSLNFIWDSLEKNLKNIELVCPWEELNNETIYSIMDESFFINLHSVLIYGDFNLDNSLIKCTSHFLKNRKDIEFIKNKAHLTYPGTLISEKFWKSNGKCTYEFDISELDKFVELIEKKFGEKIEIEKTNVSSKRPNKLILNDELKNFVWKNFEAIYEKTNRLI